MKTPINKPTKPGQEGVAAVVEGFEAGHVIWDIALFGRLICGHYDKGTQECIATALNAALSPLLTELEALRAAVKEWDLAMQDECPACDKYEDSEDCECIKILDRLGTAQDQLRLLAKKSALLGGEGK